MHHYRATINNENLPISYKLFQLFVLVVSLQRTKQKIAKIHIICVQLITILLIPY